MTKNIRYIISLAIMTVACAVAASAQVPSLANNGDHVYMSEEDGFEIAVPDQCVKVTSGDEGREYRCETKEGLIRITVNPDSPVIKTDADVTMFLDGIKAGMSEEPSIKLFGETSAKIGSYRGAAYQLTMGGDKALMIALVWDKFTVIIAGRANSKVANSAELISSAVQSFTFVSPNSK